MRHTSLCDVTVLLNDFQLCAAKSSFRCASPKGPVNQRCLVVVIRVQTMADLGDSGYDLVLTSLGDSVAYNIPSFSVITVDLRRSTVLEPVYVDGELLRWDIVDVFCRTSRNLAILPAAVKGTNCSPLPVWFCYNIEMLVCLCQLFVCLLFHSRSSIVLSSSFVASFRKPVCEPTENTSEPCTYINIIQWDFALNDLDELRSILPRILDDGTVFIPNE